MLGHWTVDLGGQSLKTIRKHSHAVLCRPEQGRGVCTSFGISQACVPERARASNGTHVALSLQTNVPARARVSDGTHIKFVPRVACLNIAVGGW